MDERGEDSEDAICVTKVGGQIGRVGVNETHKKDISRKSGHLDPDDSARIRVSGLSH